MQAFLKVNAHPRCVADEVLALDRLQDPVEADHVDEVAAPRRVDPARRLEDVVVHLVHAAAGEDAAYLRLLPEGEDVRRHPDPLVRPERARQPDAGLDLVED